VGAQRKSGRVFVDAMMVLTLVGFNPAHSAARGDERHNIKDVLKPYVGHVLTLRNFYDGSKLEYNFDGTLKAGGNAGDWTLYGAVMIENFKLHQQQLELSCKRVALEYDSQNELFRSWPSSPLQINIEIDPSQPDLTYLANAMNKIFLSPEEKLADFVPNNLKSALGVEASVRLGKDAKKVAGANDSGNTLRGGEKFVPAVCQKCPSPGYSEEARRAKISGEVVLWIVIDERGNVVDEAIMKPAGSGLDEEALKTVRTWIFKPAALAGKPVKFRAVLGVTFRLF
jgi:TonB family protein